jgi:mucin-19
MRVSQYYSGLTFRPQNWYHNSSGRKQKSELKVCVARLLTILLGIAFVLSAPTPIFAYSGGLGTEAIPYHISTVADWQELMTTSADWDKSFILTADLDLGSVNLTPVGTKDNPFVGIIDGKSHVFRNVTLDLQSNDFVGLLGYLLSGRVMNLGFVDADIHGQNFVGGLVGRNNGTIISCYVRGTVSGFEYVGGLVGRNNGTITSCYSGSTVSGFGYVGGLVGLNFYGTLTSCYAMGKTNGTGNYSTVGGLVGSNWGTIASCYATSTVSGGNSVGGLVGWNRGTVDASFWDIQTTGQIASAGGTGKTTADMKTRSTFTDSGWDFVSTWMMCDGISYPHLLWEESECPHYSGGAGTPVDPYQIDSVLGWQKLVYSPEDWDKHFILAADIDLRGESITPVGIEGNPFVGVFDGNGHSIHNVVIDQPSWDYIGLFSRIGSSGQVKNLGVVDAHIVGRNYVGCLVAQNDGLIVSCYATGMVSGLYVVGGLVGFNFGTATFCYARGAVRGNGWVGGLVGWNEIEGGVSGGVIASCYATGDVSGTGDDVGGLVGVNYGTLTSCYATGSASGFRVVGGLIGLNSGMAMFCYASGTIRGSYEAGGLVGPNGLRGTTGGMVASSFWDTQTSGKAESNGGKGLFTIQMKTLSIFQNAGWADKGWIMDDGNDTPRLAWENTAGVAIPFPVVPLNGSGTEADPYQIRTAEDFAKISWYSAILNRHIRLMADLDLSGFTLYPIGDTMPFTGTFDGNGHILRNVVINQPILDDVGLFRRIGSGGLVKNLSMVDASIGGQTFVGGLVVKNEGTIESCYVAGTIGGSDWVGGLTGVNYGRINFCHSTGSVSGTGNSVGGMVGGNSGTIFSSCATSTVSGDANNVGGLVGWNDNTIMSCYATGAVRGESDVGGLVGHDNDGMIISCYAAGTVSGMDDSIGGLLGFNSGTVESSFWDVDASKKATSEGGVGLTTAQMQQSATFIDAGWDFSNTDGNPAMWKVPQEGKSYPILFWQQGYSGGDGSPDNPYQIADLDDLIALSNTPTDWNKFFIVTSDIDLGGAMFDRAVIAPDTDDARGDFQGTRFTGTFDGNYHRVGNLTLVNHIDSNYLGLFGYLDNARVFNLRLDGISITTANSTFVGGLAGFTNAGEINGCSSEGIIASELYSSPNYVGGLVGYNRNSAISFSYASGLVCGDGFVGGLIGQNAGTIMSCYTKVDVTGDFDVGGIVGYTNNGTIAFSYSTGLISGSDFVGGLMGDNNGTIISCYATGAVEGTNDYVGGLVAINYGPITSSYAMGAVSGGSSVGGLIGLNGGTISSSFWDKESSGRATSDGGMGITTAEMKKRSTFTDSGWDFATVWMICDGVDYPHFLWEGIRNGRYTGGSGTAEDPYWICTAEQMKTLAGHPEDWSKHFKLKADIDLAGLSGQTLHIGQYADAGNPNRLPFSGSFDGNGKILSNYNYVGDDVPDYVGLFPYLGPGGQIRNLTLDGVEIAAPNASFVAGLVGLNERGVVSDCRIQGRVNGNVVVGGVVGMNWWAVVSACRVEGQVRGRQHIGGLVGYGLSGSAILECSFQGSVAGESMIGGIAGYCGEGSEIRSCYSSGLVKGDRTAGGILGGNYSGSKIEDSGSVCDVITRSFAGGLAGVNDFDASVARSYSAGWVSADQNMGGMIGFGNGNATDSFWDIQASTQSTSAGGTGRSTSEMRTAGTFIAAGWDFGGKSANGTAGVWTIREGFSYPRPTCVAESPYDFAGDYGVSMQEVNILAENWQSSGCQGIGYWCNGADLDRSGFVDLTDLMILCGHWMEGQ